MEITALQEHFYYLLERKESIESFLPLLKKIPNFNIFQINDKADSLYHITILYSRKDLVEYFIGEDYKISLPNKKMETPLHLACEKGESEIAIMLIKRSKNLNFQDCDGNTPLHKAIVCPQKNKAIIIHLIKNGCDLNRTNLNNETVLTYGLSKGAMSKNIEYLLEFNIDLCIRTSQKLDALTLACNMKYHLILEIILKKYVEIDPRQLTNLLTIGIKKKSIEIVQILINYNTQIKQSDLKLALELGLSQIWLLLQNKLQQSNPELISKNKQNEEENPGFFAIRNENEALNVKVQEYDRIFSIFERQLTILEKENNELKNKKIVIEEENEFLKSELAIWKSSTPKKPFFPEKLIDIMPIGIIDFIKKKAIENDLGGLIMDPSILEVKNQIGSGGFSKVYKGIIYGTKVAIKLIDISSYDRKNIEDFLREVNLLKKIRHPHIISLMGIIIEENKLGIVTEYMKNKSIIDIIKLYPGQLSDKIKIKMALQIAKAMNYLHSLTPQILHRDLKTANCLCDENLTIKVADLGMAKINDSLNFHTNSIGTPEYMAPEFITHQEFYNKSDVFSFGIVLWEIFNVDKAFKEIQPTTIIFQISKNIRPDLSKAKKGNEEICKLIEDCWQEKKDLRPNFDEILKKLKFLFKKIKK